MRKYWILMGSVNLWHTSKLHLQIIQTNLCTRVGQSSNCMNPLRCLLWSDNYAETGLNLGERLRNINSYHCFGNSNLSKTDPSHMKFKFTKCDGIFR